MRANGSRPGAACRAGVAWSHSRRSRGGPGRASRCCARAAPSAGWRGWVNRWERRRMPCGTGRLPRPATGDEASRSHDRRVGRSVLYHASGHKEYLDDGNPFAHPPRSISLVSTECGGGPVISCSTPKGWWMPSRIIPAAPSAAITTRLKGSLSLPTKGQSARPSQQGLYHNPGRLSQDLFGDLCQRGVGIVLDQPRGARRKCQ